MFSMLCNFYGVFPKYLDFVFGFGIKTKGDTDQHFGACSRRLHLDRDGRSIAKQPRNPTTYGTVKKIVARYTHSNKAIEICYNIRHFEEHGRDLEDPWSCRHYAVYQQYSFEDDTSTWILIQVPKTTQAYLKRVTRESSDINNSSTQGHPMELHLHFLASGGRNWRKYINYLSEQLDQMVIPP